MDMYLNKMKYMLKGPRWLRLYAMLSMVILLMCGCMAEPEISLNEEMIALAPMDSVVLIAQTMGVTETLQWSSSNAAVATVEDGKVIAHSPGEAEIVVSAGDISASCLVKVSRLEFTLEETVAEAYNDYAMVLGELSGQTVLSVEYNGVDVMGAYDSGKCIVTLDRNKMIAPERDALKGSLSVQTNRASYTIPVTLVTMEIDTEEELNKLPAVINDFKGTGYYRLGNDILCYGTYPESTYLAAEGFNGTFDGCGFAIYNFQTDQVKPKSVNRGFIGRVLGSNGIVKNISFVNAKHTGYGGFIATYAYGTFENVYVQIAVEPLMNPNSSTAAYATSVLTAETAHNTRFNHVVVEYVNPLPDNSKVGYAVHVMHRGYGYNGLYVIGATSINGTEGVNKKNPADICGAYMTYSDMRKANLDYNSWDETFWSIIDGIPYPSLG